MCYHVIWYCVGTVLTRTGAGLTGSGSMGKTQSRPWYEDAFGKFYGELYCHRDRAEARATVDLLKSHVAIAGALVLDLACGAGRHMGALADAGATPIGLDLSSSLLREARLSGRQKLLRGDMRALPFRSGCFDGAISMFTSFGYFAERGDEIIVLKEVARCLKRKGWFVLDYMNSDLVRKSLKPLSRRQVRKLDVIERRRVDRGGEKVIKEVEVLEEGHRIWEHTEKVRLLSGDQILDMVLESGMRPYLVLGDYSGGPYVASTSPRFITFCEKD
jgi:SAM-dependent methyltransferase